MQIVIDIPEKAYKLGTLGLYFDCYSMKLHNTILNGTVLPEHGRLIDADKLIKVTETMYLEGDSPLSFRVDGNTEDTMIGKFQMIDTISDAPTILEANNGE